MPNTLATNVKRRIYADLTLSLGLGAVIVFFLISGAVSYFNTRTLNRDARQVTHTHEVITSLESLLSLLKDAETGQRGFLITGDDKYLVPYTVAVKHVDDELGELEELLNDNPIQKAQIPGIKVMIDAKLKELQETIDLRRMRGLDAAREVVLSDRGRADMDMLRQQIGKIRQEEMTLRQQRLHEMDAAYGTAILSGITAGLLGAILSIIVAYLMRRAAIARRQQEWLQLGEVGVGNAMLGEQRIEQLGENLLGFLANYLDAHAGAFFVKENGGYRRVSTYGVPHASNVPERFTLGDGLLGQVAKDAKPVLITDVPEGYVTVGSALGASKPRALLIVPGKVDGSVNAVMEFGFIHAIDPLAQLLLEQLSEPVGVAVRSATYRMHLQNLLEETQRQAEELQAQSEELRVSNEELEEQSRVLKESQTRLEHQQVELEQTNSQLSDQAMLMEAQRDDLARATASVQLKAQELERASQYKSDFLANMSHELRTPLNSSLILAKLLADNTKGNLSAEQVKYAQTIQSSGNDLLALINDILDLSKIEAGHMDVRPEQLALPRVMSDLSNLFEPLAKQKNITFETSISPDCPKTIHTDRQRLEQVLKNLLSNALKFTEKGTVSVRVHKAGEGQVTIAVSDTGIGIPHAQQQLIFEAFRQADGTISRKYGGTGLGLSISRELVRLLGGAITLTSEEGRGSMFTVTLPETYSGPLAQTAVPFMELPPEKLPLPSAMATTPPVTVSLIDDDRDKLSHKNRLILVVEDDISFARILYDLAHELGFDCLIAGTAEDGLIVARQYLPNAVLLDVGLPDHSGLSVLDRLKRDMRTRHIPVHVVSANDYTQTALSLGAAGYMLKPVKREQLAEAFTMLTTKFEEHARHVLVVEDDPVQRESVAKLLGSAEVEITTVGTAAECLTLLKTSTFDCMVLDLTLPDASGYSLLETLSRENIYSFPPVIVYTGRDISADQERQLRRYSKSIIIKGAKSPERLLDEVTLFLHQVVSDLPAEQQKLLEKAHNRDAVLEERHILIVEDDVRNVYALSNILEPRGAVVHIARNGREALDILGKNSAIELVLMDVMMPEMDGMTATREIRKRSEWKKLPIIMLTAKAMRDDQERCLEAGANDYMAKPLDVEKLLSLIRVWMPR